MRKSRFTEEEIVGILQEYAAGAKVSELRRPQNLEAENSEHRVYSLTRCSIMRVLMLDNAGLKRLLAKKS